ncbi:uncharacterized protein LY79DRAFT_674842 [Colletotrichum navitas]|uniref:Ubiquitin-like protease family profile domain-containing protein n=1 Tax=Colletotrichum navitas TaxID=681940 RepID=A0AAD8PKS3_9PEZI|nr:uncharacterized protein LY79DRAFT_674842 [Colletotrichum navitas]KAK1566259.1 hypothetical protein LY79DRAFT_674842 [Colletotrichum navitas]
MSGDRYNLRRSARLKDQGASSPPHAKRPKVEAKPTVTDGESKPVAKAKAGKLPILSTDFLLWSLRENQDVSFGPSRSPSPVIASSPFPDDTIDIKGKTIAVASATPKAKTQKEENKEEKSRGAVKSPEVVKFTDDELVLDAAMGTSGYHHALVSLDPQTWLNDDAVFGTLEFLAKRDESIGVMNPIHLNAASTWDAAPPYFRPYHERRLGDKKTLLIPACRGSHWTLFVWDSDGSIRFYDSLFSQSHLVDGAVMLRKFWSAAFGSGKPMREPVRAVCAQQSNGYDCGLHVIRNGDVTIGRQDADGPEPPVSPVQMRNHYRDIFKNCIP